jgi:hypothetical protein
MAMLDALRLPIAFDAARLRQELERVETEIQWHDHPDYTVATSGDWKAVALLSAASADHRDPESLRYRGHGTPEPTAVLRQCPYLLEVVRSFKTEVHRARLMNLRPGTKISEHRDYGAQRYSVERGFIRVHIPVRTHDDVHFWISRKRIPMQVGEAWYTNVCQPHAVQNNSTVHRVHLVLDMKVNDWVLSLFPPLSIVDRARGVILRTCEPTFMNMRLEARRLMGVARKLIGDMGARELKRRLTSRAS